MTADQARTVIDEAVVESRDGAGRRLIVAGLLLLLVGVGVLAFTAWRGFERIDALQGQADDNARTAQTLAEQVTKLGGTPVVQPPTPGERGEPGAQGEQGPPGRDGRDGVTPACVSEPTQCRGATGEPGPSGQNGVDGQAGKDGTNGVDGQPGQDGRDGVNGQPPAGWTWIDEDGRTQSCARDAGSPDTAPTYTCTASSTGPPGTSTTTPPLLPIGG